MSASEWQPIETAPKGETILLWNGEFVASGAYEPSPVDGFLMHRARDHDWGCDDPTHWMPLPKPPSSAP